MFGGPSGTHIMGSADFLHLPPRRAPSASWATFHDTTVDALTAQRLAPARVIQPKQGTSCVHFARRQI